jgi:hypothetical protein
VGKGPWRLPSGKLVADSTLQLADGVMKAPIDETADGAKIGTDVWTGLTSDATRSANCEDWTLATGDSVASIGRSDAADIGWIATLTPKPCDQRAHFYCFEK